MAQVPIVRDFPQITEIGSVRYRLVVGDGFTFHIVRDRNGVNWRTQNSLCGRPSPSRALEGEPGRIHLQWRQDTRQERALVCKRCAASLERAKEAAKNDAAPSGERASG